MHIIKFKVQCSGRALCRLTKFKTVALACLLAVPCYISANPLISNIKSQTAHFLPPTMGWSSWNTFNLNISEAIICGQADAMVDNGLDKAGYKYINIDDGYFAGRDSKGNLAINTDSFPNGMKAVADYIHSKGLKAGIYSEGGDNTCGNIWSGNKGGEGVGLYNHEQQDCDLFFRDWGYDFIKVDFCGGDRLGLDERRQYTKIHNAIVNCEKATGRRIVFNLCRWAYPGTWVSDLADSWRTTGDIQDKWRSIHDIIKENLYIQAYTGGGHYNDMDMLEVGRTRSADEDRLHMAYWCIASSPLLIGCDMRSLNDRTLALLKNADLIAMNQDRLGLGAPVTQHEGELYVVAKDMEQLHGNKRAVVVMNLGNESRDIDVDLRLLQFTGTVRVHDCFTKVDRNEHGFTMRVTVPGHGCQAFIITGTRCDKRVYEAEEAWLHDCQELENHMTAQPRENATASQGAFVENLGGKETNYLEWRDVYVSSPGQYNITLTYASMKQRDLDITVNGKHITTLTDLRSGSWDKDWCKQTVTVKLKKGSNTVRLSNADTFAPYIDCMTVEKAGEERHTGER